MTHDPLCPLAPPTSDYEPYLAEAVSLLQQEAACQCDLIAKARADERRKRAAVAVMLAEAEVEDDRKTERDRIARIIVDSEAFMWLMAGTERERSHLQTLRKAWTAYCEVDGGYGRWGHRQRNRPWEQP